jgi:type VI protein secretion system component Hcp
MTRSVMIAALSAAVLTLSSTAFAQPVVVLKWPDSSISMANVLLTSYSQTASRATTVPTVPGKITCGQVIIMKLVDQTSPEFLGKVFAGSVTNNTVPVIIGFWKTGTTIPTTIQPYYRIDLYGVAVTSITQSDAGNSQFPIPTETIILEATKFRYSYSLNDGTPPVIFGWDCASNVNF